jgi:hypothetical protein
MPLDPHECHEYAKRCMKLAAETTDPSAHEILVSTAQNWEVSPPSWQTPKKNFWRSASGELLPLATKPPASRANDHSGERLGTSPLTPRRWLAMDETRRGRAMSRLTSEF